MCAGGSTILSIEADQHRSLIEQLGAGAVKQHLPDHRKLSTGTFHRGDELPMP